MRCRCGLAVVSGFVVKAGHAPDRPASDAGSREYDRFPLDEEDPMAVAFIQEFAISDRGTANYDGANERLTKNQPPPEGLLINFAGFDDEDAGLPRRAR
jgi:hypothetical protein